VLELTEDAFGGLDQIVGTVTAAVEPQPRGIRVPSFERDFAAFAGVVAAQPPSKHRHIIRAGADEIAAGELAVVAMLALPGGGTAEQQDRCRLPQGCLRAIAWNAFCALVRAG